MVKVSYHPEPGSPEDTEQYGYTFRGGKAVEVNDDDPNLVNLRQNQFFKVHGEKEAIKPATKPAGNTGDEQPKGPFTVNDVGNGWFSIVDADGNQVGNKLRESDAKAFEAMSAEEQAEYLK